jgi:hypothetical protein
MFSTNSHHQAKLANLRKKYKDEVSDFEEVRAGDARMLVAKT